MPSRAPIIHDAALATACLAHCDVRCPKCSHSLRAVTEPRCPECGLTLHVHVTCTEHVRWPWIGSLLVATLATGFLGFVAPWLTVANARATGWHQRPWSDITPFWPLLLISLLVLFVVLGTRRLLARSSGRSQVLMFLGAFCLSTTCVAYASALLVNRSSLSHPNAQVLGFWCDLPF